MDAARSKLEMDTGVDAMNQSVFGVPLKTYSGLGTGSLISHYFPLFS